MALQFPSLNGNSLFVLLGITADDMSQMNPFLSLIPFNCHSNHLETKVNHKTALWAKWVQYILSSPHVNELEPLNFILTNPSDKVKQLKEFRIAFIRISNSCPLRDSSTMQVDAF